MTLELLEMEELKCGVCLDLFGDGNKCPRLLSCGHGYCTSCLEELMSHSPYCPVCKIDIKYTRAELVPVNFALKSLLHRIKGQNVVDLNKKAKTLKSPEFNVNETDEKDKLPSEGFCFKHANYKQLRCMTCSVWVCGLCVILDHKQCRTLLVPEALQEMKDKKTTQIKEERNQKSKKLKQLDTLLQKVEQSKSAVKVEIKQIQRTLKNKIQQIKELGKETENLILLRRKEISDIEKLKEIEATIFGLNSASDFQDATGKLSVLLKHPQWNEPVAISMAFTSQFKTDGIIQWIEESGCIYAVHHGSGGTKWGLVQVKAGKLRVHSFQKKKPSEDSIIVSFRDLASTFVGLTDLPTKAFLEIWDRGCYCGDVIIETNSLDPRALNFLLLCSGLKDVSYKETKFYEVVNKGKAGEYIGGGDYSFNDGRGSYAVVRGIQNGGIYKKPVKKGIVVGCYANDRNNTTLSRFFVVLKDEERCNFLGCFGKVEEGLQVLEKVAMGSDSKGKLNDALIKDCGLIF